VQAFGAPGFIKINTALVSARASAAPLRAFRLHDQFWAAAGKQALPALLAGFVFLGMWNVPAQHWRWLFFHPGGRRDTVAIVLAIVVRTHLKQCGYKDLFAGEADHADQDVRTELLVFSSRLSPSIVWIMAIAYACTGAVRQSIDHGFPYISRKCIISR